MFRGAVRSADHRFDVGVLGQRAQFAAGKIHRKVPGIILALLPDHAADTGAGGDRLRQRRGERHARAPVQAIAEQQFLAGFGLVGRIPESHDVVEGFIGRRNFHQLHGALAPAAMAPDLGSTHRLGRRS